MAKPPVMEDEKIMTGSPPEQFLTTRWSMVRAASGSAEERTAALTRLFQTYWQPLYGYLRREGRSREEAEDVLQDLDPRRAVADCGQSGARTIPFPAAGVAAQFAGGRLPGRSGPKAGRGGGAGAAGCGHGGSELEEEAHAGLSPEMAYDRAWAQALLERARQQLCEAFTADGKSHLFDELFPHITNSCQPGSFAASAQNLGMNEKTARVARQEFAGATLPPFAGGGRYRGLRRRGKG